MTNNNIRLFLWGALAFSLYLNYTLWQADYAPKPVPTVAITAPGASKPASIEDTVPQATQAPAGAADVPAAATTVSTPSPELESSSSSLVRVITDVLVLDIDLKGGTLVYAELPGYPVIKGQPQPVVLFNHSDPATNYSLQSGLAGVTNTDARPTHVAMFSSAAPRYELAAGRDELRVPLTWTDGRGVTVTKTFVLHRGLFAVGLEYAVDNKSAAPWVLHSYARIVRTDAPVERSMFKVESFAFRGPAAWEPDKAGEKNHYTRMKLEKPENQRTIAVKDGWLAGMQHHFVSAIVPDSAKTYDYSMGLGVNGRTYILGAFGPAESVGPGKTALIKENLFVGPKLQKQLVTLHPELDRVADYSWATVIARPLFWLLQTVHNLVGNWGLSIILVTMLLKALFYPLAQYSGKSMGRMRTLTPRIKNLQETYKDDREKLGRAMMELYKTEKVNPVSGCLPMVIQMPVFLAFYWVLLESVEMRQAPFLGWINDLSARDPLFILPLLNGLAMWTQYKLNPPPPDPMQAKVFQFMPVVFSVMFALFPAGLVLYWVTNTSLSILQQWNINRHIAADEKKRKSRE